MVLADRARRDAWLTRRLAALSPDERATLRRRRPHPRSPGTRRLILEPHLQVAVATPTTASTPSAASSPTPAPGCSGSPRTGWSSSSPRGSGSALGITTGLQFLPVLLLSPYAGVIADRFPKRRLLQVTQAVDGRRLAAARPDHGHSAWSRCGTSTLLAFVFGIGSAFDAPARQSFVSEMVEPDDVTNAVGLNSAAFNLARILGPGAGRPDDRRPRRRRRGDRLGHPHQRRLATPR